MKETIEKTIKKKTLTIMMGQILLGFNVFSMFVGSKAHSQHHRYCYRFFMLALFLKKTGLLLVVGLGYALLDFATIILPFVMYTTPLSAFVCGNLFFILGLITTSFIPGLFFQRIYEKHNTFIFYCAMVLYCFPGELLGSYVVLTRLMWFVIFIIFFLKTSKLTLSWNFWVLSIVLSGLVAHPMLNLLWSSDILYSKDYGSFRLDAVTYHIPSASALKTKEAHSQIPEEFRNTKTLVLGMTDHDIEIIEKSIDDNTNTLFSVLGCAVPNPFKPIVFLTAGAFDQHDTHQDLTHIMKHELTHVNQINRYGFIRFISMPYWKKEAHATYIGQNISTKESYQALTELFAYSHFPNIEGIFYWDKKASDYALFYLQGWYYLAYLGMDLDTFFSDAIDLADWMTVKEAWLEAHKDWVSAYENQ